MYQSRHRKSGCKIGRERERRLRPRIKYNDWIDGSGVEFIYKNYYPTKREINRLKNDMLRLQEEEMVEVWDWYRLNKDKIDYPEPFALYIQLNQNSDTELDWEVIDWYIYGGEIPVQPDYFAKAVQFLYQRYKYVYDRVAIFSLISMIDYDFKDHRFFREDV